MKYDLRKKAKGNAKLSLLRFLIPYLQRFKHTSDILEA